MKRLTSRHERCGAWLEKLAHRVLTDSACSGWLLARHLAGCPRCRRYADQLGRVTSVLSLLAASNPPANLLSRSNIHALRMVNHRTRADARADALRHATPQPSLAERAAELALRMTTPALATLVVLMIHTGLWDMMLGARDAGERIARDYDQKRNDSVGADIFTRRPNDRSDHTPPIA